MIKSKRFIILYIVALVVRLLFAVPFIHDWDGFVFSESAKNFLKGETPYMTVLENDPSIYPDSDKPMEQQWYAYPPLPLLMFTAPLAIPTALNIPLSSIAETLLLKSPFILGDLLAALLIFKFLENKNLKLAHRAELLVLFNPLIIWISSAWGMFDIWMANFLLISLLLLRKSKFWQAGISLALACTTKLFPVFFLPVIAVYILKTIKDASARWQVLFGFLISLAIIIVPFFITSPRGFLNQNFLMHIQRSTQGLSIPALFDYYKNFYQLPEVPLATISSVFMYLSIFVVFLLAFVKVRSEESLIWAMIATYIPILLFNKVTNEQYFVLLIVLLIALLFNQTEFQFSRRLFAFTKSAATYGVLIAASFLGFHFLGFLLPEVTHERFNSSTNQLVFYLSRHFELPLYTYPDSPWTFYNLLATLSSFAMIPFIVLGLVILIDTWKEFIISGKAIFLELLSTIRSGLGAVRNVYIAIGLGVLIGLVGSTTILFAKDIKTYATQSQLLTPVSLISEADYQPLPKNPKVGTFYNVWWNNFSHYKDFPYGDWRKTSLEPQAGFYTSKNSYFVQHIKQMKEANIDFALIPYHLYDRKRYLTFGGYAEKMGLYYAPMIELYEVLAFDKFRPITTEGDKYLGFTTSAEARKALENVIISSLADNYNSPAVFRIDNKPVVFLYDGHWFYPSWEEQDKIRLSQKVLDRYEASSENAFATISDNWKIPVTSLEDIVAMYPTTVEEWGGNQPQFIDFRKSFLEEYEDFWDDLKKEVESKVGSVYFITTYTPTSPFPEKLSIIQPEDTSNVSAFDNEYFYSIANTWVTWQQIAEPETIKNIWERQVELQSERKEGSGEPLFLTTTPTYSDRLARPVLWFEIPQEINGKNTYDWAWETALKYDPDYILITSWNEFFEGTAIEPSKEYGDYYIKRTAEWAKRYQ